MILKPWETTFEPHRVFGNTYFAGTIPASTHLIDTGEGLILIDTGYQETLYLMSIPGMAESIIEGGNTPIEDCLSEDEVEW